MLKFFKNDWVTLILALILSIMGFVSIASSEGGFGEGIPFLAKKQIVFLACALVLYLIISNIDYKRYTRHAIFIYGLLLFCLLAVLVVGVERGGSQRWILFGSYQFQPSEIGKLMMILVLARTLTRLKNEFSDRVVFLVSLAFILPVVAFIALEPDLGMSISYLMIFLVMTFVSEINWRIPVTFVIITALLVPAAWPLLKDYQKNRIMTFVNPTADPLGKGYQSNQSRIAIGSGGLTGKGIFKGTQNKLNFIPFQSTDFIFSIIGEEGGFLLSCFVVILYLLMFMRMGAVAIRAPDMQGTLIVWGITSMIFLQTFINIGMTMGIMPVTGLPLPFMSSGINSLLLNFVSLGVVNSVYKYSESPNDLSGSYVRIY
jgi:rod shape determining protein RodA